MTELEKAARKCVFDELCVWCCKRVYTHCEYMAKTKDEPICKEGKVVHDKFIAGAQWQAKQSPWISVEDRLPDAEIMGTNCRVLVKTFDCTHVVYDVSTVVFMSKRGFISHWMPIPE